MVKFISLILFFSSCNQIRTCEFQKEHFIKVFEVLNTKKVLELSNNEINIVLPSSVSSIEKEIIVNDKSIRVYKDKESVPQLIIKELNKDEDGMIKVRFQAYEVGYRYRGELVFECLEHKLVYKDIHYLSEID